jgi:hypothetical protein
LNPFSLINLRIGLTKPLKTLLDISGNVNMHQS